MPCVSHGPLRVHSSPHAWAQAQVDQLPRTVWADTAQAHARRAPHDAIWLQDRVRWALPLKGADDLEAGSAAGAPPCAAGEAAMKPTGDLSVSVSVSVGKGCGSDSSGHGGSNDGGGSGSGGGGGGSNDGSGGGGGGGGDDGGEAAATSDEAATSEASEEDGECCSVCRRSLHAHPNLHVHRTVHRTVRYTVHLRCIAQCN